MLAMHLDEIRPADELFQQKVNYALRHPEEAYLRIKSLERKVRSAGLRDDSGTNVDTRRRLREAFAALEKERAANKNLSAELEECKGKLHAVRNSRTMKVGKFVAAPYRKLRAVAVRNAKA